MTDTYIYVHIYIYMHIHFIYIYTQVHKVSYEAARMSSVLHKTNHIIGVGCFLPMKLM